MTCSATSFGSSTSSPSSRASSAGVSPRRLDPAIGRDTTVPFRSLTMGSGEAPTTVTSGKRRKYRYGLGLTKRRTR